MQYDAFHGLRIICRCGAGGFGEVFFVEDISCKKMALKVVPKSALGECYRRGRGIEKDIEMAKYWYRKAAEQGHKKAKEALEDLE